MRSWKLITFGWLLLLFIPHMVMAERYSYSYIPKKVYFTQVFPVTILGKNVDKNDTPVFLFDPQSTAKPLDPIPAKVVNGNDVFYTFYFVVKGEDDFRLPKLTIKQKLVTNTLDARLIRVEKLDTEGHDDFCGLMASDCTLLSSQISSFDSNHTLVSIKIKAHEANPDAIKIPFAIEGGLERLDRQNSLVNAEYYFVIPSNIKDMNISYYNTVEHRFITTNLKTDYRSKPVAAEVELNPKASWFERLKKYGSIALAFFFALMYWWRRDLLYLVLLVVVAYLISLAYKPNAHICIKEGAPLYILPTHNSRVSTNIKHQIETNSLGDHGKYYKINYQSGIIGWINEEDLCKN